MTPAFPKRGRVKLEGEAYKRWRDQVMARDRWRCRRCDRKDQLTVHHLIERSELRLDTMENGITLCVTCHDLVQHHTIDILGDNANLPVKFRFHEDKE